MCPPSALWYSSDSFQLTTSGIQRGTEIASVPPGRTTRTSSLIASTSAWMCSSTSAATTRSNSPSANGRASASPSFTSASAPAGTSPASRIAANHSRTVASSSASWSNAMTSAPRLYISNAWRPAPQPMSSTRSPGRSPSRSKSTVSTSALLLAPRALLAVEGGDGLLVRGGGGLGHRTPAEQLLDAGPSGHTHRRTTIRVVEQRRDRLLELAHVAGGDQVGADPVRSDDLRDRPGPRHHQRGRAGHELGGREREALVERGHAGHLGRAHHLDELGVADAVDERHPVGDAELVDELLGAPAGLRPGHEDQRDVALDGELGEGLEQGRDALHRRVGAGHGQDPAGNPRDGRWDEDVVDPEQDGPHPGRVDPEVARHV